jgi:hypothetical protein
LIIRYEDLSKDFRTVVDSVSYALHLNTNKEILSIPFPHRKGRLSRTMERFAPFYASLSSSVLPRKGIVGDWANEFDVCDEDFFWSRAGQVMEDLGY